MNKWVRCVLLIAVIVTAVCGVLAQRPTEPWVLALPIEFRQLYAGPVPTNQITGLWAWLPCESISTEFKFEGGGARGNAGDYVLTFRKAVPTPTGAASADGAAEIRVVNGGVERFGIPKAGEFSGNIGIRDFGKLCHLSKELLFESLADAYPIGIGVSFRISDGYTYGVSITEAGKTKRVTDRGYGPVELWALEQAIHAVATRIRWTAKVTP